MPQTGGYDRLVTDRRPGLAVLLAGLTTLALLAFAPAAGASARLQVGLLDDAQVVGNPDATFPMLQELRTQLIRVNLRWDGVARAQPVRATDPADPAYDWSAYDKVTALASQAGIRVVFSIVGTPGWANRGKGPAYAPRKASDLRKFATAAAQRYSGSYQHPEYTQLPRVDRWIAWNEPNLHVWLRPQFVRTRSGFRQASPAAYARICNAVVAGVHAVGRAQGFKETVACGVTAPGGNNRARAKPPSISPLPFLRGMFRAGADPDVYAHHPYPSNGSESPTDRPRVRTRVTLGNIDDLLRELDRAAGRKLRLWITEYGYQTNPPDAFFGIKPKQQAQYMALAYSLARAHPRIDMLVWFLLVDERETSRWQSGLVSADGKRKRSYATFRNLPRKRG
jgi:hypothetical protein